MRKMSIAAATAMLLLVISAGRAGATPPLDVTFEVPTDIPSGTGPFAASGPAVDEGLVCPSGDSIEVFGKASGFQSQTGVNFQIVKQFTCDDGSGEFLVKLQVRLDFARGDNFNWDIVGGTGDYEDLHGTGSGIGLPFDDSVLDLYSGQVHVD